ncbi:MAG: hypothetical protein QXW27_01150 [Candidatus Methanomethylicaceae archaeon]
MVKEVLIFLFFLSIISYPIICYASIEYIEINPENPVKGDILNVIIKTSSSEEIPVSMYFQKIVPTTNGFYEYRIYGVKIPYASNTFKVEAYGIKNLNVAVKLFFFWITKSINGNGGYASISQSNIPIGTYDVVIYGEAENNLTNVELRITASTTIITNEEGLYTYSLDTSYIPEGTFTVKIGNFMRIITLSSLPNIPPIYPSPITPQQPPTQYEQSPSEQSTEEPLIEENKPEEIATYLMNLTSKEAVNFIENLTIERAVEVLSIMDSNSSAKILQLSRKTPQIILNMETSIATQIVEHIASNNMSIGAQIIVESIKINFNKTIEYLNKINTEILANIIIEILRLH